MIKKQVLFFAVMYYYYLEMIAKWAPYASIQAILAEREQGISQC